MNFRGLLQCAAGNVLGLCLSLLLARPLARAESPEPQDLVAEYRADAGCPDRAEFTRRVRARLAPSAGGKDARFAVSFVREKTGVHGRLTLVGHETGSARALTAASCEEAVDALSLVAALMLRDLATPAASSPAPAAVSSAGARAPARTTAPATRAAASAQAAPSAEQSSQVAPSADPESATTPEKGSPRAEDSPKPAPTAAPVEARAPLFSAPRLALFATGLAVWSVSPNVRPGLGLGLALAAASRSGLGLAALLSVRATLPDLIETEQGRAQFVWVAGMSALCIASPERYRLRVAGCGVLELGAIRASGTTSATGHAYSRFWGALGPSLAGSLSVHPRVTLRLGGELLGVLVRDRFFLAEQLVFSVPRLAYRVELALQITIL